MLAAVVVRCCCGGGGDYINYKAVLQQENDYITKVLLLVCNKIVPESTVPDYKNGGIMMSDID